jgi:pyridoxine 5-phosphate synthase
MEKMAWPSGIGGCMTELSVNVNKIGTLRNSRGENRPDVLEMALLIESFGADGITVHPRPDERHIKKSDVVELKKNLRVPLNVEGFPSPDFIAFMEEIRPAQITLVPDPPHVLTSNAGFTLIDDMDFVTKAVARLKMTGARISLFIDPKDFVDKDVSIIKKTGADRIELYTKAYADHHKSREILASYRQVAERVSSLSLGINAGHDLSLINLSAFLSAIPFIAEVSIGHAIVCDALLLGMEETIKRYLAIVRANA